MSQLTCLLAQPRTPHSSLCVCLFVCLRGYYPKGGGEVVATVSPVKELQAVTITDRGTITKIYGRAFVAGVLPFKVKKLNTHHQVYFLSQLMKAFESYTYT